MIIIFYIISNVNIPYNIRLSKKEWSIIKMIWNFSRFTKVLKMYFGLYKAKLDI